MLNVKNIITQSLLLLIINLAVLQASLSSRCRTVSTIPQIDEKHLPETPQELLHFIQETGQKLENLHAHGFVLGNISIEKLKFTHEPFNGKVLTSWSFTDFKECFQVSEFVKEKRELKGIHFSCPALAPITLKEKQDPEYQNALKLFKTTPYMNDWYAFRKLVIHALILLGEKMISSSKIDGPIKIADVFPAFPKELVLFLEALLADQYSSFNQVISTLKQGAKK